MVQIGIAQWCLDCNGVDAVIRAADLRFCAIQIDAGEPDGAPYLNSLALQHAYMQAAQDYEVEIVAIALNILNSYGMHNTLKSDIYKYKKAWEMIQLGIDAAANMGIELVFFPSFEHGEIHNNDQLLRVAETLHNACLYASESNILLATENTLGIEGNLRLLSAINHPRMRILMDSLNPVFWGHDTATMIRALWPYLSNQFHAKDGVNQVMGNATLNTGQANFAATASVLQSLGFTGYVILENEYGQEIEYKIAQDVNVIHRLFSQ